MLLVVFCCNVGFGQTVKITGTVKSDKLQLLSSATLQLKDATDLNVISYGFTNAKGEYAIPANIAGDTKFYLIASYLGFKRDTITITTATVTNHTFTHNFVLEADENQLKEVSIAAPKPAIQVDNDTTTYKVASFTSPEDQNLEAVLKKMPGMEVSKDGTLFFKQKKVAKVLLEGDDLTGENYKAITQNLKPAMVDEVQAIEHWVEDDLLKGIISSEEIALNLTLKDKRKQKVIGSVDASYGTANRNDVSTNLIGFSSKTKSYAFVRNNNIGSSQEDIFKLVGDNRRLAADGKLIHHQISTFNPFDANALALNNSLAGSVSSITRFSPNFKINTGLYGMRNKLYGYNEASDIYYEPINAVRVDRQDQASNNKHYQADVNADYLVAQNARIVTKASYKFRPQEFNALSFSTFNSVLGNEVNQLQNDKINNFSADLKYTVKTNTTSALIITAKVAKDGIDQNYNPISDLYQNIPAFNGASSLSQTANIDNLLIRFDAQGLKKKGKHYFYANLGGESSQNTLKSNLFNQTLATAISGFLNDNTFFTNKANIAAKYTYNNKKVIAQSLVKASVINQRGFGADTTFFVVEPDLRLTLKLTQFQTLGLKYNFLNTLTSPMDYHPNPVLTDLRSINVGLNSLFNYGTHNFNVNYSNSELKDKYFSFNANANGQVSNGGFLINNFFENTLFYGQKTPYLGMKNLSAGAGLQKFMPFLASSFNINYNSSINNYYAQVVNEINNYTSLAHTLSVRGSTGFKLPINFSLEYQYQNVGTQLESTTINNQKNFKYSLQSRYQVTKAVFNLVDFNFYDLNGRLYKLLNTEIQYKPIKGKFKYSLYGKNLFNVSEITNSFVNNISETNSSTSILGRYVLGGISMSIQ